MIPHLDTIFRQKDSLVVDTSTSELTTVVSKQTADVAALGSTVAIAQIRGSFRHFDCLKMMVLRVGR